jgi:UDP-N-acetyl-D-mannosaminuronic acid dehydrogenase
VDPWFIVSSAPHEAKLIHTARLVNDNKPNFVLDKIHQAIVLTGRQISELSIACFGLSFKPDISDLRESPALNIAQKVSVMGFSHLYLVEPHVSELNDLFNQKNYELVDFEFALVEADILVLLVDHKLFKDLNLSSLDGKQIVDTRGVWL